MSMPTKPKPTNQYQLPCMIRSKLSAQMRGVCWLMYLLTTFTLLFPWLKLLFSQDSVRVIRHYPVSDTLFFLAISILILSYWLYADVFRRAYIFMDDNSLHLKFFLHRKKQIPWEQIGLVDMVQPNRAYRPTAFEKAKIGRGTNIRIILREPQEKGKRFRRYPKVYSIPLVYFSELDCYRFLNTVGEQMEIASKRR